MILPQYHWNQSYCNINFLTLNTQFTKKISVMVNWKDVLTRSGEMHLWTERRSDAKSLNKLSCSLTNSLQHTTIWTNSLWTNLVWTITIIVFYVLPHYAFFFNLWNIICKFVSKTTETCFILYDILVLYKWCFLKPIHSAHMHRTCLSTRIHTHIHTHTYTHTQIHTHTHTHTYIFCTNFMVWIYGFFCFNFC